jgi:hypothetical protein
MEWGKATEMRTYGLLATEKGLRTTSVDEFRKIYSVCVALLGKLYKQNSILALLKLELRILRWRQKWSRVHQAVLHVLTQRSRRAL